MILLCVSHTKYSHLQKIKNKTLLPFLSVQKIMGLGKFSSHEKKIPPNFVVLLFSCLSMSDSSVTPWTVACQATPSLRFSRQEYWSGLPFPSPGDLPDSGIEPSSPALVGRFFTTEPPARAPQVAQW